MLVHANFSFLKPPLFLVVRWCSNKGQIPACPGQHAEDITFSWDLAAITQSAQLCYCQTRDSTTSSSLCPCPTAPSVEQDWCCTAKGKWAHSPPHPRCCTRQPPLCCGSDKPIRSTNYFRSKWECGLGMRCQTEAEPKRAEETGGHLSCRCILVWNLQRDFPLRVYTLLTCFSLTHTLYRDLAKALIHYSLIAVKHSQLHVSIMLINTWWLTAKCLQKGIQISICSTIFLTKRRCWKDWSRLTFSDYFKTYLLPLSAAVAGWSMNRSPLQTTFYLIL